MKYLFIVTYKDGTEYRQNQEDVSITDPIRSCYFDIKQDEVARFSLVGNGHVYSVDLIDGHFEVDSVPFRFYELPIENLRLVFWRQHTHQFNLQHQEKGHDIVYRMGWQALDDKGENVQRIMEFS